MWKYNHISQSPNDEYLMHYGIPGMRWGVRKAKYISSSRAARITRRAMKWAANDAKKKSELLGEKVKNAKATSSNAIKNAKQKALKNIKAHNQRARGIINNRTYTSSILAGSVGGLMVGNAVARKYHLTGKKKVASMLIGSLSGAKLGSDSAAKKISSNNSYYRKNYGEN